MIDRLHQFQDDTFHRSDETLAVVRIAFFFFALAPGAIKSLGWATEFPDWLRDPPPGLPSLIGAVPPSPVLSLVVAGAFAAAAAGFVGFKTRVACLAYSGLMLVHHSVEYSFGKIDHDLLIVLMPAILASTGWGNAYSVDAALARSRPLDAVRPALDNARALAVLYSVWAVAFFTAAMAKIEGGWLSPSSQMAGNWVQFYRIVHPFEPILARVVVGMPVPVRELLDWGTVIIELAPLAALLLPRVARWIPLAAIGFHLGVLLAMGINFAGFMVVYMPLIASPNLGSRLRAAASRLPMSMWLGVAALSVASWRWIVLPGIELLGADDGWRAPLPGVAQFAIPCGLALWAALDRGRPAHPDEAGWIDRGTPRAVRAAEAVQATVR